MLQVIKKRRIVLASVLKPVDDTRMLEKIGATLADSGEYKVSIIGYPSTGCSRHPEIELFPLPKFERLSFKRLIVPWIIFKNINQVKPELIIINTPELLIVAILNRIFFGRIIIYDVLENYYRNIRFTQAFPSILRPVLAFMVRLVEFIASPLIHHFLLAEKGYNQELGFARPHTVLQNKLPKSVASTLTSNRLSGYSKLLFSGTLAASSGVFEAIKLCKGLHEVDDSYSLTIIGYCALPEVLSEIKKDINNIPFIKLIGGDSLVPHNKILDEISKADRGIVIYPPNPSTQSSIPTKLYEYLALQLPVLIRHTTESHQLVEVCKAGIVLNDVPDYNSLSQAIKNQRLAPIIPDSIYWESSVENFINCLKLL